MEILDMMLMILAAGALVAFACRLDALQYSKHQFRVIVLHASLAAACFGALVHAYQGITDMVDFATVIAAIAFIATTFKTWSKGVPIHFETRPAPLDAEVLKHVGGGRE